jgi:hypothetical protein
MKSSIRGVILGSVGLVIIGLAGCGEDNEKKAADAFKDTQTAPREILEKQPTTKADMAKQYSTKAGGAPYGGGATYGAAQKGMRK